MFNLAYRNLLLFFKDKTTVFLSFLAEFIVIVLYILFIRDNLIENFQSFSQADLLIDVWMMAGILGISSTSTTMGVYTILVEDQSKKIYRDFMTAPIRHTSIIGGYLTAAISIGIFMTFFLFLMWEFYISIRYDVHPGADRIFIIYGIIFLSSISSACLTLFLVSFLKTSSALASCCTILGSLIGFLTGIYLPMGSLPETVKLLVMGFPVSHGVVLFRQNLMEPFMIDSFGSLEIENAQYFIKYMGIQYYYKDETLSWKFSICYLLFFSIITLIFSLCRFLHRR